MLMMALMQAAPALMSGMGGQGGLFGQPGRFEQIQTLTPQQQQLQQNIMGGVQPGMNYYQGILGGDTSQLEKLSAPIMRQFEREIAPGIAGRFAAGNSMRGSAFQNALARAGTDVATNIGSLQANLLGQAAGGLTGMAGLGMQPSFQPVYRPQVPGAMDFLAQGLGGMGQGLAQGYGASFANQMLNPMSGATGQVKNIYTG
jgi:hypothetical protein